MNIVWQAGDQVSLPIGIEYGPLFSPETLAYLDQVQDERIAAVGL
jgi:hypothetical protein